MSGYNTYEIGNSANSQQQPQHTGTGRPNQLNQLNERLATAYDYNHASRRAQESFVVPPPPIHRPNRRPFDAIKNSLYPHRREMNGRHMAPNNKQHGFQATPVSVSHPQSQTPVFGTQYSYGGAPINLAESSQFPVHHMNNGECTINPQMLARNPIEGPLINNDQQLSQPFHHGHTINPQMLVKDQVDGAPIDHGQQSQLPAHHMDNGECTINPQMLAQNLIERPLINNDQQLSQTFHHEHTVNPQMLVKDRTDGDPINFAQSSQLPVHQINSSEYTINPQMLAHNQIVGAPINHGEQSSQLPVHHEHTVSPQMLVSGQVDGTPIDHGQQSQSIDYADIVGYLDNPHMFAHLQAEGTPISYSQQSQLTINGNQHQASDFSHDFSGHQQSQMSTDYTDSVGCLDNPHMFANLQAERTPINHGQQSQLPIHGNHYQAQDIWHNFGQQQTEIQGHHASDTGHRLGQQASIDYSFQNGSINFDQPLSVPIHATDNNGHEISQRVPAHFQVAGTSAQCGQQPPQMPINQTNFNGVNNNRQSIQATTTTRMSSFANLSAEDQNAEFKHFFQQRLKQGDTTRMEFAIFKSWYIGEQLDGKSKPTLAYGVAPLHQSLRFASNVPKYQPMIPPDNREHIQPSTMIYQGTGRELTTGFQHTTGPLPTLNIKAMRPNNEQYLQNPRKSTKSNVPARRASKVVASAGQSPLPVSLPSMVQPALPSTARAPASTPLAVAMPTVARRDQKLQSGNPQQMGIATSAKGKEISREQRNEATSAAQPTIIQADQIRSLAGKYTISISNLPEVVHYEESYEDDIFHALDAAISVIDTKIEEGTAKVEMPRNNESRAMVETALQAILLKSIARLSLENSSDARKSFENYVANIGNSSVTSLPFAPESQFVEEETKVVGGTKQTVRLAKDGVSACATHTFPLDKIECDHQGAEVKGSYSMYTKTTFTNAITPLKYSIGIEIQVAEIDNKRARSGLLNYERPLSLNAVGEPSWAEILDLLKLQAAEWGLNTGAQGQPTSQTSTSTSLSNRQQNDIERSDVDGSDIEQQMPFSRPVQGQTAKAGQPSTPEQQKGRGDKRKRQQQPEFHASPVISTSSSGDSSPSSNSSSKISNATTGTTSVSPRQVAELSRLSDNSRPPKRSRNGYRVGSLKRGTSMMSASSSMRQSPVNEISQNDHMHPARSLSESVRSPIATANAMATEDLMPTQVAPLDSGLDAMQLHKQAMQIYVNNPRPYEYPTSEFPQPSRTLSTRSDMPTQIQARLLRTPTEAELAPHREQVLSVWKSSFPKEKKSS